MIRRIATACALVVVATALGVGTTHPARACSCIETTLSELMADPTFTVVIAEVADGPRPTVVEGYQQSGWTLEISDVFGTPIESPVEVATGVGSGDCGFMRLPANPRGYILYENSQGSYATDLCVGIWDETEVITVASELGVARQAPLVAAEEVAPGDRPDRLADWLERWWIIPIALVAVGVVTRRRSGPTTQSEADLGSDPGPPTPE